MSPSCSFMWSISRSLLVDSKPQMQQQNKSTQYSMGGWPVRGWLWAWDWSCAGSFPWGLGVSPGHCEGSVVGVGRLPELSTAVVVVVVDVGVGSGSIGPFALCFEVWVTAGLSAPDSSTADNFWGALGETKDGLTQKNTAREGARLTEIACALF